ncbi:fumarate hydratase [Mycolicibacterium smegmatis]|uniref:Fumarate hydratase class I n=3 Tax=Mycolicibacterium smegmatis TaxID=1772 RepID=A0QWL6_MYCS2|nr:fumarate hydratase [Mycolicibacterium smegmatis]ABK72215.1 fumarate hydratase class I, anaerobic [Mycolicibacterium smegmatis MC2 155]AFP39374.1 Fumarate hydratase class [Mycolicibacterium smegmatis MC2 155]AIU08142.1 fumarate hydratase [Mycolicibacterium smegmatis MC2 155]AIU14767.1 fumarate hydratase [Mycolicibacterium smegmatis]AIU21390.1 fumarate hydratase [Mycolicibacterium smegmatis]
MTVDYTPILPLGADTTDYRRLDIAGARTVHGAGREFLDVDPAAVEQLAFEAYRDVSHLLRSSHLRQVAAILEDPEASPNDRYVATELLRNANVASGGVFPMCQDTGTAIVHAWRGRHVLTDGRDAEHLSLGIARAYRTLNLRYSQVAPVSMFDERNTGTNLPAQIEILAEGEDDYRFLFIAKGCGSANKSFLFQETPALLTPDALLDFVVAKAAEIGTSACPPYHLAVVIGGTSAEFALKTAKLASAHHLDALPVAGSGTGHGFRDLDFEHIILTATQQLGIGAQFGGKYFCHDVRVIRLPRHAGSLPVAIAVSCAADRHILGRITRDGVFLEQLETDPARFLPDDADAGRRDEDIRIDLDVSMAHTLAQLSAHPVGTRVSLTGTLVVARDLAHAKIRERLDAGEPLPDYLRRYPVFYAGPAKTPSGHVSGSLGPTTAGRMDSYVERFQSAGGSLVMLAKGNRSDAVRRSCQAHGGFYLGSIGGPAARLARDFITSVETLEYGELGMEAVLRVRVRNFPAFIVIDDKGNDFYRRPPLLTIGAAPQ